MPERATGWPALMTLAVHELRTPATVVTGYVRMLLDGLGGPLGDFQQQALQQSAEACARMTEVLADMSTLAAIEAGRLTPAVQNSTVASLLVEAQRRYEAPAGRAIGFRLDGPLPPAPVRVDHVRTSRGLAALAAAGAVSGRDAAEVVARVTVLATEVLITLSDPAMPVGPPPSAEPLDELRGGLGVSVPLARRVIEAAGGTVSSTGGPGDAAILVWLPIARVD